MTRKFQILIVGSLVVIVVLTSAIGLVWIDIQTKLQQKQAVLTRLIVVTTVLVMVLIVALRHKLTHGEAKRTGVDQQRGGVTVGGCHLSSTVDHKSYA